MRPLALIVLVVVTSACGVLDVPAPTNSNSGLPIDPSKSMKATIDGIAWEARFVVIENPSATVIRFTGVLNPGETSERRIVLQFLKDGGASQTFAAYGGPVFAQVGVGNSLITNWSTTSSGPTGTLAMTRPTPNHYVGTFSFDAQGEFAGASPTVRKVTSGTFDIAF